MGEFSIEFLDFFFTHATNVLLGKKLAAILLISMLFQRIRLYRMAKKCIYLRLITSSNIDQFSNFFIVRIRRKFVIVLSLKIPPHLKYIVSITMFLYFTTICGE